MGRKVFLSVLGTGWYNECEYVGGNSRTKTKFIQVATLNEVNAQDWSEDDVVYILVTQKAKKENWSLVNDERKCRNGEIKKYIGLEKAIMSLSLKCKVKTVDIKDGMSQSEMWDIFNTMYQLLETGDELYFDFTHGFRYLPMFVLVFSSYAKYLKNVSIAHMSYGNFEVEGDEKPIMDLMSLATLQNWTSTAMSFTEMGRVKSFATAILMNINGFAKDVRMTVKQLGSRLIRFEGQIETCRGIEIMKSGDAAQIKALIQILINKNVLPEPIRQVLLSIEKEVRSFVDNSELNSEKSKRNIISALRWCKKYGLVQQGYTLCQEGLITVVCDKFSDLNPYTNEKKNENNKMYRDFWSSIFGIKSKSLQDESKWGKGLSEHKELTRSVFSMDWVKHTREVYNGLTQKRNQVNHGGFTGEMTEKTIRDDFENTIDSCIALMEQEMIAPSICCRKEVVPNIFLNVSNHPLEQWSDEQRKAAQEYGILEEIPFPPVSPELTKSEMDPLVKSIYLQISDRISGKNATVHIMGEMTLTYALVKRLQAAGIKCVASTTERCVKEYDDGTKESVFKFVRFREYES